MISLSEVLKRPLVTEKSSALKGNFNQVSFEVHSKADKTIIKKAVESFFKVKVKEVRTSIVHGKIKAVGRHKGQRPNWKKAVVSLNEGQTLEFFEGV